MRLIIFRNYLFMQNDALAYLLGFVMSNRFYYHYIIYLGVQS